MKSGAVYGMIVTGVVMLVASVASGFLGFIMWALALNGFMGQERAVNASMITYFVLAFLTAITTIALSVISVYFLSVRRGRNAAISAMLSILVFVIAIAISHTASVFVSAIAASVLSTNR